MTWRTARNGVFASAASLVAAIAMLAFQGIQATRIDFLVIAGVLVMLLLLAWAGTRWQTEAKP